MSKLIDAEALIEKLQDEGADVTADYGPEYGAEFDNLPVAGVDSVQL